jgi:hypothetical protein
MAPGPLDFLWPSSHLSIDPARLLAPEDGRPIMTLFYSEEDQFYDLTGTRRPAHSSSSQVTFARSLRRHIRRAIGRTGAALKIMHQAVVAAKMRRVERELMFHNGAYDRWFGEPDTQPSHASGKDAANVPQRPLILGDKWDF